MYLKYVLIVFLGISVACCADKGDSGNIGEFSSENITVDAGQMLGETDSVAWIVFYLGNQCVEAVE